MSNQGSPFVFKSTLEVLAKLNNASFKRSEVGARRQEAINQLHAANLIIYYDGDWIKFTPEGNIIMNMIESTILKAMHG